MFPGFGFFEDVVREHAAVPADVFHPAFGGVLEPVSGASGDVEFSVRIVDLAVAAGLVVGAGAVNGAVVLGDAEIDGPRAQGVGHGLVGGPEFVLGAAFLGQGGFGGVALIFIQKSATRSQGGGGEVKNFVKFFLYMLEAGV